MVFKTENNKPFKLRILHISARADIGGGPKHLHDLSKTMSKNYDSYQVIAAPNDTFFPAFKQIANKVVELPHRKLELKKLMELRKLVKDKEINIIHSHGRGAGIYSRLLSYMTNARVVHTFHGIHQVKNFIGLAKDMFDKIFAHRVDHYICVSTDEQKKAEEALYLAYDSKSSVILNGVDTEKFASISPKVNSSEKYLLGTLCRFNFQKGIDIAIECINKNQSFFRSQKIIYIIQGDGEDFHVLKERVEELKLEDIIKLPGPTREPIKFFEKIDAYISFSRWEGFPLSVIEAMAAKKPCILSNVPGHQTFIENELCLSFQLDNDNKLLSNIKNLIHSIETSHNLQNKAISFIQKELTLKKMSEKTCAIYKSLQ